MTETTAYDLPSWSFVDPFQLDPGFAGEDNLLPVIPPNPFGVPGWDLTAAEQLESNMAHEMGSGNPAKSDVCYQNYPDRSSSIFTDFKAAQNCIAAENFQSVDLDELLRSTSQLATERALYMTTTYASPMMDPCSSPEGSHLSSSSVSEADWEREISNATGSQMPPPAPLFSLPDAFPPLHPSPAAFYPHQQPGHRYRPQTPDGQEGLTPLEMPDGSMRFTANWLPVDPEGGFTISTAAPSSLRHPCDLEYPDYPQDAFISMDHGV